MRVEPNYRDEYFNVSNNKSYSTIKKRDSTDNDSRFGSPSRHYERVSNSQMLSPGKKRTEDEITAFANSYKRYLKTRHQPASSPAKPDYYKGSSEQSSNYKYEQILENERNNCITPRSKKVDRRDQYLR